MGNGPVKRPLAVAWRYKGLCGLCLAPVVLSAVASAQHARLKPSAPSWSLSPLAAPPVTVADIIGMTTFGSGFNPYWQEDIVAFSPDRSHVATVVKRGNVVRNTVDYALVVFRTDELHRNPKADTVATLSSSTNGPGMGHVRWLADNATLAFVGERPGTTPQVLTVDIRTHTLTQLTHATTTVTNFAIAPTGDPVVYSQGVEAAVDSAQVAAMRAHGFVVPAEFNVADVIDGNPVFMAQASNATRQPFLNVARAGTVLRLPPPADAEKERGGKARCSLGSLTVAPNGEMALVNCMLRVRPAWGAYDPQFRRPWSWYNQYFILDLKGGWARPLSKALVGIYSSAMWAPNSQSVVLTNALLPLDGLDSAMRVARATHRMVAEVDVSTGRITAIAPRDSLWVVGWDARSGLVELVHGWAGVDAGAPHEFYRKTSTSWTPVPTRSVRRPTLVIDQGMNVPPRLVVVDPATQAREVVYDPNPGLLSAHRFGREEVFHWTTRAGNHWMAGLYYPPDYAPGRRYPLVIQTHGFDSTTFAPNGSFTTGEAAQPMANAGILVLQMPDGPTGTPAQRLVFQDVVATSREAPMIQDGVEGAIDALDRQGLIDRTKIGMQGFSRTCYYTLYFLTQSSYALAAATMTDGWDSSYLQYLLFGVGEDNSDRAEWYEKMYGGPPWGTTRATWLRSAPGFNLDRITTPLHLTALNPGSVLGSWEPYAGLLLQGKPAELLYIPDGDHILVKPWQRLTSQESAVAWYRFWLQGYESPDPTKAEQYARWRELRKRQQHQTGGDTAATQHGSE